VDAWIPKLNLQFDYKTLDLNREEAFVLSQLDGATSILNLVHLTGLPKEQVREVLLKLYLSGALIELDIPDDIVRDARLAKEGLIESEADFEVDHQGFDALELDYSGFDDQLVTDEQRASDALALLREEEALERGGMPEKKAAPVLQAPVVEEEELSGETIAFRSETSNDLSGRVDLNQVRERPAEAPVQVPAPLDVIPEASEDVRRRKLVQFKKLYKAIATEMNQEQRIAAAGKSDGDELCALCFDQRPEVVAAVMNNPHSSVIQGRLIAAQHKNPVILARLAEHPRFGIDSTLRRYLLGNKRGADSLYQSLFELMSLGEVAELCWGGEITERAKRTGMKTLRKLYQRAKAEERLDLIVNSDGACLTGPGALNLDTKTAALLCKADLASPDLVHNLASCCSTPTNLVTHLSRLPQVRSSAPLRNLLQQHPNKLR
jgi:hypothetical protein